MIVTFLGTGSAAPTRKRNVSAVALWFTQTGKWWLFDCGEGTQHQVLRTSLKLSQLEKIFITHLHGDHLYGLVGLMATRSLRGGTLSPLDVYGPPGLNRYVNGVMQASPVHLQYEWKVTELLPGRYELSPDLAVECLGVNHRGVSYAYAVAEKNRPGRFLPERARRAGIPPGPLYGRLKRGESVWLPDGRVVHGREFVGPPQAGRKIVFSGDTAPCPSLAMLASGADLLIHEATYAHAHLALAERSGHSTSLQAAETARAAGVGQLVLTHVSSRYEGEEAITASDLLAEAREVFPATMLAEDFLQVRVKRKKEILTGSGIMGGNEAISK